LDDVGADADAAALDGTPPDPHLLADDRDDPHLVALVHLECVAVRLELGLRGLLRLAGQELFPRRALFRFASRCRRSESGSLALTAGALALLRLLLLQPDLLVA